MNEDSEEVRGGFSNSSRERAEDARRERYFIHRDFRREGASNSRRWGASNSRREGTSTSHRNGASNFRHEGASNFKFSDTRHGGSNDSENRRPVKRRANRDEDDDVEYGGGGGRFKRETTDIHEDLVEFRQYMSQMKAHWKTNKIKGEEEAVLVCNVLRQASGKENLIASCENFHFSCNVGEFLSKCKNPDIISRFTQAFNVEKVEPSSKIIRIYESLVDIILQYLKDSKLFEVDDENNADVDYPSVFHRWLQSVGVHVVDQLERYLYDEIIFTQRVLCSLVGRRFVKDGKGVNMIANDVCKMPPQITGLFDRVILHIMNHEHITHMSSDNFSKFVLATILSLAEESKHHEGKKLYKKMYKVFFIDSCPETLISRDMYAVVDAFLRHCRTYKMFDKCVDILVQHGRAIAAANPSIFTGIFEAIDKKDDFEAFYDRMKDSWTIDVLGRKPSVAAACRRFDVKQQDFLDRLYNLMVEEGGGETNFIYLAKIVGIGACFNEICNFTANMKLINALQRLSEQEICNLAMSSYVFLLEYIVQSKKISDNVKLSMMTKVNEKVHEFAMDKFGSRLLDQILVHCNMKTIKQIAFELLKHKRTLLGDKFGKFIVIEWGIEKLDRGDRRSWELVIASSKERKAQRLSHLIL